MEKILTDLHILFNSTGCVLFFYHVLLFTVGIGTVILGGISLGKT